MPYNASFYTELDLGADTIFLNEPWKAAAFYYTPVYRDKESEIIVVIGDFNEDFSNAYEVKSDTFYSLHKDKINQKWFPQDDPKTTVVFGKWFDSIGEKTIRGFVSEFYEEDEKAVDIRTHFEKYLVVKEENATIENQEPDTTGERTINELTFLKNKDLLPANFDNDKVVSHKNYRHDNLDYNLLKIEYSSEMSEKYLQDPYINLIYVKSGNELVKHIVLYSIDEEDVGYAFTSENNIFFEQYDASTGWKKYISFLISSSRFIETDQLDETEEIVQSSINLTELTYNTNLNSKTRKFRVAD